MLWGSALPFMGQFGFMVSFGSLRLTSAGAGHFFDEPFAFDPD
jgi:hypothetical protein